MQDYPHHYPVEARADAQHSTVSVTSNRLPTLATEPPAQFGGAGDKWSPETLLVAAVADCFILTFRGIARASRLPWSELHCDAVGVLDRVNGASRFTEVNLTARLSVPADTDTAKARLLLERAEQGCLVTNSLLATPHLECTVEFD